MTAMLLKCAFAIVLVAVCPGVARGQDRRPYVGISAMISIQDSHRPGESPSFPRSGVGGTALGITAEAGGFLSSSVSIAFEASIPARFTSIQETDYFLVFRTESRHRDLMFSGLVHFELPHAGRVRAALVAGPSVAREDTVQRTAYDLATRGGISSGMFGPFGPETSLTRWTVGLTGGVDVAVEAGPHVSIVPQIRIHWLQRADQGEGDSGFLGLSAWVIRPAVGIRARF
jgi:hypothetical protein